MNNWISAVFSPTGGCSNIATAIAGARMGKRIDLSAPVEPLEVPGWVPLLAVVPVYGGRVPAIAIQRLRALKGQGGPAIAVVVYGNRAYEDALPPSLQSTASSAALHPAGRMPQTLPDVWNSVLRWKQSWLRNHPPLLMYQAMRNTAPCPRCPSRRW